MKKVYMAPLMGVEKVELHCFMEQISVPVEGPVDDWANERKSIFSNGESASDEGGYKRSLW